VPDPTPHPDLRLLADLNLSPQTVEELRRDGWDILRVNERLSLRTPDLEILSWARENDRVVITQDLDFSTLIVVQGWSRPSVVILRLSQTDPATVTARLREVLPGCVADLQAGCAMTIADESVRVRRLPIN
jgi:predicted nuclease of predicted toxin-antitoxin system